MEGAFCMKSKIWIYFTLCIILFTACTVTPFNRAEESAPIPVSENTVPSSLTAKEPEPMIIEDHTYTNMYTVNLDINPYDNTISGIEKLAYKNTSKAPLSELYFNVYMNAYTEDSNVFLPASVYRHEPEYSTVRFPEITVNHIPVSYMLDETILVLRLDEPISPEEVAEISLHFEYYMPEICYRSGGNSTSIWLTNFLPIIGIYNNGEWVMNPFSPMEDTLFAEPANFEVSITTPPEFTVIATGSAIDIENKDTKLTNISAKMVRDFALVISSSMQKKVYEIPNGPSIYFYHTTENQEAIERFMNILQKNAAYYSEVIGSYPYSDLDIVECELLPYTTAEYPQLILVDKHFLENPASITFESLNLGKQWFHCIVGNNAETDSFFFNGLTTFLQTILTYGEDQLGTQMRLEYEALQNKEQSGKAILQSRSPSQYIDMEAYEDSTTRAKLMVYEIYKRLGRTEFFQALRDYYVIYSFQNTDIWNFSTLIYNKTGIDVTTLLNNWIQTRSLPKLSAASES